MIVIRGCPYVCTFCDQARTGARRRSPKKVIEEINKLGIFSNFPIISHSWEVLSSSVAIKHLDKSAFHHHGTGIPAKIRPFFGLEDFLEGENRPTTLLYKGKSFSARFYVDPIKRLRLFWKADFDDVLKKELPGWFEKFSESEEIKDFCNKNNFEFFRGEVKDVLDRYYQCAKKNNFPIIVRITSDNPLIDPKIVDDVIHQFLNS